MYYDGEGDGIVRMISSFSIECPTIPRAKSRLLLNCMPLSDGVNDGKSFRLPTQTD